jgi:hypothetical protein
LIFVTFCPSAQNPSRLSPFGYAQGRLFTKVDDAMSSPEIIFVSQSIVLLVKGGDKEDLVLTLEMWF